MSASVSIIVGVYNGEKFLAELLDSIKNQICSNWVCICVDDGSVDSSAKILKDYSDKDNRFRIITRSNGGVGAARNTALDAVETPYVMFADQDDRLMPNAVAVALDAIERYVADVVRYKSNRNVNHSIFVWEHIFRYEAIKEVRFLHITGGEDIAFFWEIGFLPLKSVVIKDELYYCRPNQGSFSRAVSPRYIQNVFAGYTYMRKIAQEHTMSGMVLARMLFPHVFWFSLSIIIKHLSWVNLRALISELRKFLSVRGRCICYV